MRTRINKITAILLSVLTIISILAVIPVNPVTAATATEGQIKRGQMDNGYNTYEYFVTVKGVKTLGFCVDPYKRSPTNGSYNFYNLSELGYTVNERREISKVLYYGHNGPAYSVAKKTIESKLAEKAKNDAWNDKSIYTVHNATHEALAYLYHKKNNKYNKHPEAAQALLEAINGYPQAPLALIYRAQTDGQDILYGEFKVHFLILKNSTDMLGISMKGIQYSLYDGSTRIGAIDLEKKHENNDATKNFEGTQAGVYVSGNSYSGYLSSLNSSWAAYGKTAGSTYTLKNSISFTAKETRSNPAFKKNNTSYKMVYYADASDGLAIFAPTGDWPVDVQYIKLQMLKVSANPNSPSPLAGAVYGVSNSATADFTKVKADRKITIGNDGYGTLGTSSSTNKSVNNGEDEKYANKPSGGSIEQPSDNTRWYCKEIVAPKGYELDDKVYEFTFDRITDKEGVPIFRPAKYEGNQRKRLVSTDMPLVKLQLAKDSDIPEITNNNSCYSLKDAEFDIFWKEDSTGTVSPDCDYTAYTGSGTSGYVIRTDSDGYGCISEDRDGNLIASSGTNMNDQEETVFYGKPSGPNIRLMPGRTYYCKERVSPKNLNKRDAYYEFKDTGLTDSDGVPILRASNATMVDAETVFSQENLLDEMYERITGNSTAITNSIVGDPFSIEIVKKDSRNSGRSLSNAIFKINYYDIESTSDEEEQIAIADNTGEILNPPTLLSEIESSQKAPKRTWYIKTVFDSEGNRYYSMLDDSLLTSFGVEQSGSLFKDLEGQIFIPLGIVSIEEVKAPDGFEKTNNVYLYNLKYDNFSQPRIENKPIIDVENTPKSAYAGVVKVNTQNERVAGAVYYLYDDYSKAERNGYNNIENCVAVVTTTTKAGGDIFVNKDNNDPYECIVNKQYWIREVSAPEGYELDPTIYNITPRTTNDTPEKMITRTSTEGNVPYGSLRISKTSNDELVSPYNYYNTNLYIAETDANGQKTFVKDNTSLKNMCFGIWEYDGDTYDSDKDPMPTTDLVPQYPPIDIGTTDENGQIQWDRLKIYKNGTEKQHYIVKELGYEVFFPTGKDRLIFQDGKFKWSIRKASCIHIGDRYFEGLVHPVFITNFRNFSEDIAPAGTLYPKYFYGNREEAISNARGKIITLEEEGVVTEFAEPFHNTSPTTKLEINKTTYTGEGNIALFELRSEYGNMVWSDTGSSLNYCVQGCVEITGLPACIPKSNTSICIPMKYSIVEKGLKARGVTTMVEGIMNKPEVKEDAIYVPLDLQGGTDRKIEFDVTNIPKTYTVSLHKDAFDETVDHNNVKDIWFEIVGVITDYTISDSQSIRDFSPMKASLPYLLKLPPSEIKKELAKYYAEQCAYPNGDDPYIQYYPGVSNDNFGALGVYDCGDDEDVDRVLPILGYDKNGNPITRVTIKTDENGDAQSHFFNGEELVDNPEYVHLWSIVDNPDGTSTWVDRTAQDNVGSILYGREDTLLPEGERLNAREKLNGFVIHPMDEEIDSAINYAIGIRVSELGKLTDPSDPNSFHVEDRYLVPEPQYAISGGVNSVLSYNFDNGPIVKDLELIKKNDSDEKLSDSTWLMYDKKTNAPIKVTYDQKLEKYVFAEIGSADELIDPSTERISDNYALITNSDGNIYVKDIPYGEYYLKEEEPPIGYVPYGEPIYFEITDEGEAGDVVTKTYTVVDGANIMPNTGGPGTVLPIVVISISIPAAIFTTFYLFKKRKRKIR